MRIQGKTIAEHLLRILREQVLEKSPQRSRPPHLVIISVEPTPEENAYLRIKSDAAHRIGASIDIKQFEECPTQDAMRVLIKSLSHNELVDGIILQQPLPTQLNTAALLAAIDPKKDIESQCESSPYDPPLGLAVVCALLYGMRQNDGTSSQPLLDLLKTKDELIDLMKHKQLTIIGNGATGGRPIAKLFRRLEIPFTQIDASTKNPEIILRQSDVILSAVGAETIKASDIKPGVGLISAGYRKIDGKWVGDYDESEIATLASFYTPTPAGIGPLDVSFVMHNLITAWD